MDVKMYEQPPIRRQRTVLLVLVAFVLLHGLAAAQGLTGALIGTVKDDQGGVLASAVVRLGSPALIGGLVTLTTNERGQLRFPSLPPGLYELDITMPGFATSTRTRDQAHALMKAIGAVPVAMSPTESSPTIRLSRFRTTSRCSCFFSRNLATSSTSSSSKQ